MEGSQPDAADDNDMDAFLDKFRSQPYRGGFHEDHWEEDDASTQDKNWSSRPHGFQQQRSHKIPYLDCYHSPRCIKENPMVSEGNSISSVRDKE
ncbi:Tetratricopeptide repeat protein 4 [Heterocephalus glaber]|uniref:Tetratricopeptide repeat protein 4 n=1 Tax=Heterocephalus glaber TaxID=10181 RepID=G5BA81_HETGA|nr:Tetratricopeptide repeat protein 4 [Heterocephalus glaber]